MTRARRIAAIAARELGAQFRSPVAYVVGALFIGLQGVSFWAVVEVLSDPARPAPLGGALRTFFGGTFLHWSVAFMLIAALAMRPIADDRRTGNWEALLTTPVEEGEAVVGKWLGVLAHYLTLWAPTLAFPALIAAFAAPGARPEWAAVASAYAGVAVSGAAFVAVALAAGAATSSQVVAAVGGFAALMGLLVGGELAHIVPRWAGSRVLAAIDLRAHMDAFARGDIDSRAVALFAGVAAAGLAAATALAGVGRRRRDELAARGAAALLVAAIAALVVAHAARRPLHWDVTAGRVNALSPDTLAAVDAVTAPVDAILVRPDEPGFAPVYDEIDRVLRRIAERQPLVRVRAIDPVRAPAAFEALVTTSGVPREVLAGVGAVVFRASDGRVRAVDLLDMAELGTDELDAGTVTALRAEPAFAAAIRALTDEDRPVVCAAVEHGELPVDATPRGGDAAAVADRLRRDGVRVDAVGHLASGVPAHCRALLVLGPTRPLSGADAAAVDAYLSRGGALLLAVDALPDGGRLTPHGLELVLARFGIRTPDAVAVDPAAAVAIEGAWGTYGGYAAHPVTAGFEQRRLTLWTSPRAVFADPPAVALVTTSPAGWAETDLAALFGEGDVEPDAGDRVGPTPVAAASERDRARVVVLGAARPLATDYVARGAGAGAALVASAVRWLVGKASVAAGGSKTPERVRLIMTAAQRRAVFALGVVGLPLAWVLLGAIVAWRRRRG